MTTEQWQQLEAEGAKGVHLCLDCGDVYKTSHRCKNPHPTDPDLRSYYYNRRKYLMRAGQFDESDNDPSNPEQAF